MSWLLIGLYKCIQRPFLVCAFWYCPLKSRKRTKSFQTNEHLQFSLAMPCQALVEKVDFKFLENRMLGWRFCLSTCSRIMSCHLLLTLRTCLFQMLLKWGRKKNIFLIAATEDFQVLLTWNTWQLIITSSCSATEQHWHKVSVTLSVSGLGTVWLHISKDADLQVYQVNTGLGYG